MKRVLLTLCLLVPFGPAMADITGFKPGVCPITLGITVAGVKGSATDCTEQIKITDATPGAALTISLVTAAAGANYSYESDEDVLIGVWNGSSGNVSAIQLQGFGADVISGETTDSFGFDGDGITVFTGLPVTPGDTSPGYAGPNNTFSNISADLSTGEVDFISPLKPGDYAYFSLEFPVFAGSVLAPPGGGGGQTGTPEPASIALLGAGLFGLGAVRRRR